MSDPKAAAPAAPATADDQNKAAAPAPEAGAEGKASNAEADKKNEEQQKSGEGEAAKPAAPATYDLKLPDGSPLDPSRVERIVSLAKERGLSNEAAQELLNGEHEGVSAFMEHQQAMMAKKDEAWIEELKSDPDFGRDKFDENLELAKRALDHFGDAELKQELNKTRLGNYPRLVKMFNRIGRAMASDKLILPSSSGSEKKSLEDRLYPDKEK